MGIVWNSVRVALVAITVVVVAELSKRYPRYGALFLSLPIVSVLAFIVELVSAPRPRSDLSTFPRDADFGPPGTAVFYSLRNG